MKKNKVGIIGSGFGALSLANRLQGNGYQVTIFEKQEMPGGHAFQLKKKGYTFDMGPSLITIPRLIDEVFESAGKDRKEYLDYIPLDPYYRIFFHDKSFIDYSGDSKKMKKQLEEFGEAETYDKFMEYAKSLYKVVIEDGLGEEPFLTMKDFFKASPGMLQTLAFLPATTLVNRYFKNPKTRFTFSFHPLFIGGNPFRTPSLYLMIPYLEKKDGVWFTKGGMYSVVQAFVDIFKSNGGVIKTNEEVLEIITKGDSVKGLKTKNGVYDFDIVVSNAHYAHTYKDLIKKDTVNKKTFKGKKYSMSCYLAYLGVKKKYPQLEHHTLISSERYKGLIDDIFDNKILAQDFSMYLHVPSKTDKSMAPEGCESMYVLIPTPNLSADIDWSVEREKFTNRVLKFLEKDFGMEGLRENIEVLETFVPTDFEEKRNNYLGSAWSLEPTLFQSANFRLHNKSDEFKNLYFVGASTHPGGGVRVG